MRVIYYHLPKTGGTTIRVGLEKSGIPLLQTGRWRDRSYKLAHIQDFLYEHDRCAVVSHFHGHVPVFRQHADVLATLVRHPAERVYSLYRHALDPARKHALHDLARRGLEAFIAPGLGRDPENDAEEQIANGQSKQLTGTTHYSVSWAEAMETLAQFDLVSYHPHVLEFGKRLGHMLGMSGAARERIGAGRENMAPENTPYEKPTSEFVRAVLAANPIDLALYREARSRHALFGRTAL